MQPTIALICAAALLSSGCAPKQITGTVEQVCQDWRQIGVRKADVITDDTAKEIVGNNVARDEWCVSKKKA